MQSMNGRVVTSVAAGLLALGVPASGAFGQATDPVAQLSNPSSMGSQRFGTALCFGLVGNSEGGGAPQQVVAVGSPWANITLPGGATAIEKAGCLTVFREFS